MRLAQILVTTEEILPGRCSYSYEWDGHPGWPVALSGDILLRNIAGIRVESTVREGALILGLPWPLRVTKVFPPLFHVVEARRTDSWLVTLYWLDRLYTETINFLRRVKARAILTLHIWGLAYVPEGAYPSLRHIGKKR